MTFADLIELLSSPRAGSIAALFAATAAAVASIFTTIRNSEAAELRKKQLIAKRVLATRAIIVWENMSIIRSLGDAEVPQMLIPGHQTAFKRLEESIDDAIKVGLSPLIIGSAKYALTYHSAIVKDISFLAFGDKTLLAPASNWRGEHLLFGMTRLIDRLLKNDETLFPAGFASEFYHTADGLRLLPMAYNYIHARSA